MARGESIRRSPVRRWIEPMLPSLSQLKVAALRTSGTVVQASPFPLSPERVASGRAAYAIYRCRTPDQEGS
jgi:hypothetical protein